MKIEEMIEYLDTTDMKKSTYVTISDIYYDKTLSYVGNNRYRLGVLYMSQQPELILIRYYIQDTSQLASFKDIHEHYLHIDQLNIYTLKYILSIFHDLDLHKEFI